MYFKLNNTNNNVIPFKTVEQLEEKRQAQEVFL